MAVTDGTVRGAYDNGSVVSVGISIALTNDEMPRLVLNIAVIVHGTPGNGSFWEQVTLYTYSPVVKLYISLSAEPPLPSSATTFQ